MRDLKWYLKRLSVMKPAEVVHRLGEFLALKQMQCNHLLSHEWAADADVDIHKYVFCVSRTPQLPELPWFFEPTQLEVNALLSGKSSALGFEWCWWSQENIWHQAPDTKKVWPKKFFGAINYREGNPYGDIRVAWEPSRLQQLVALALLARKRADLDQQVITLLEQQFLSWIDDNPPLTGIHYVSAMECALRIVVVSYALDMVRDKLHEPDRVWSALLKMVDTHAKLVEKRLSLHSSAGNHTMAECAGLIYAGILFPELDSAERWKKLGLSIMEAEMDHQILQDGGGAEQAFFYQLSVLDLCGLVLELLKHRKANIAAHFEAVIIRGRRFLCAFADTPDRLPGVGDNDSAFAFSPHLRLTWSEASLPDTVVSFADAGYTVIRSRNSEEFTLLFDHGPLGMAPSYAHGHADALSITLSAHGRDLLIDPGTYAYTGAPEWRAYFRGSRAHNTVTVDGRDQARQETAFLWSKPYCANLVKSEAMADGEIRLLARHDGYRDVGVIHWRGVVYYPSGAVFVWDYLDGDGVHDLELNWHLGIDPIEKKGVADLSQLPLPFRMKIQGGKIDFCRGEVQPICGWKSIVYGSKEPITTVQSRYVGALPHEFVTQIEFNGDLGGDISLEDDLSIFRQWVL